MKIILSWRRHYNVARVGIFLVTVALVAGMVGCGPTDPSYNLTIASTAGGSVITPGEGTFNYDEGTVVNLVAEAEEGYYFVEWTGDADTIANVNATSTTITMTDNYEITANFEQIPPGQFALTISSTSGGSVTVPGEATIIYDKGTVVNLVATPDAGYRFVNWTGDIGTIANVNAASTTITMNGDYSITAIFVAVYDLTISSTAGGSVTTPGEGTSTYDEGTVVNLVATPDVGYSFFNWTGNVGTIANVNAASTTITMNGDYSILANFVAVYDLTISSTAGGLVTTPGEGTSTYDEGTVVILVAEAEDGYYFINWTGDVGTIANVNAASTTITMTDHYSITANFEQEETVYFADPNLEAAVRDAIGKPTGPIYSSDLVGLTSLSASQKNITDLTGLEHCTSLTVLHLSGNQISDVSPLANLITLTELWLESNQISDISSLANLTNLISLDLRGNQISDISPLANLTNLTELRLSSNQISNISPLANLTSLTELYFCCNQISDVSPLANLTNLIFLYLYANQISDISPLADLTSLTYLGLYTNQISDISPLANLTSLTSLYLHDNQISDISPLVQNEGLGSGDYVALTGNPLNSDSINIYIPQLEARGVIIYY